MLQPFAFPRLLKPVLVLLVLAAAGVSWFASAYGALMDRSMIANVIETDAREVGDLLNFRFVLHMVLFGVLPALLVAVVPLRSSGFGREALLRGGTLLGSVALVGLVAVFFFQDYAVLLRGHRELRLMINPSAAIYASLRYATAVPEGLGAEFERIADRVERGPRPANLGGRRKVLVFVVGETARADHTDSTVMRATQSGTREARRGELRRCPVLRDIDGGIRALHVLRSRARPVFRVQRGVAREPARSSRPRRYRCALAREQFELQGRLRARARQDGVGSGRHAILRRRRMSRRPDGPSSFGRRWRRIPAAISSW